MAETDSINTYFFLKKRINESRERLRETDRMFFAQTMSSYVTEDGMQIISKGFDIQRNCNRHLDITAESSRILKYPSLSGVNSIVT